MDSLARSLAFTPGEDVDPDCVALPPRVEQLGEALEGIASALATAGGWGGWLETLPVASNLSESARLSEYERELQWLLPHLQAVCHRPRALLRSEDERTLVGRARRISTRAVAELAAHPEDWERRSLTSVVPHRILATHIEDLLDTYDNRVAARLVDHVLRGLSARLARLREAWAMASEVDDADQLQRGSHWRRERLCELWGQAWRGNVALDQLEETLKTLTRLEAAVLGLLDSPLYRAVPRSASVAPLLLPTNVLVNDPHYRHVATLWRRTVAEGHHRVPTPDARPQRRLVQRVTFSRVALLVVTRALALLGWRPVAGSAPRAGIDGQSAWRRQSPSPAVTPGVLDITLSWTATMVTLIREGRPSLYIEIADFGRPLTKRPIDLLESTDRMFTRLTLVAGRVEESNAGDDRASIIPISPWSLDGTERVARQLGLWLARHTLPPFPLTRRLVVPERLPLPSFLSQVGADVVAVRPSTPHERSLFEKALLSASARLAQQHAQAHAANRPVHPVECQNLRDLHELTEESRVYDVLATCPVCDAPNAEFEARLDGAARPTWWCRCQQCSSEFGTRPCPRCKRAYPVLILESQAERMVVVEGRINLDDTFGKDLWARPRLSSEGVVSFDCTECFES